MSSRACAFVSLSGPTGCGQQVLIGCLLLLLPQDWDTTTVEWFSNDKETDIALPEYKLTFLWLDKTLACGVDQVCGQH